MGFVPSLIAPAAMLAVLALVRLAVLRPLTGFGLFMLLWAAGAIVSGVAAWRALRGGEQALGLAHGAVALVLLGALLAIGAGSRGPAIHDITTDPADPPEFLQATSLPGNRGRDLSYPHGDPETPDIQARAYPDLASIRVGAPPERALEAARETARALGWEITWSNTQLRRLEAHETTALFRFVDDVAIRVRAEAGGSVVDLRSTSRVGRSDLGANAARIRRFAEALRERIE